MIRRNFPIKRREHTTDTTSKMFWWAMGGLVLLLLFVVLAPPPVEGEEEDEFCYEYSAEGGLCFPGFRHYKIIEDGEEDITMSVVGVVWYDDYVGVTEAWAAATDKPPPKQTVEAWSYSDWSEELALWVCEIHAVKPEMVIGDARMDALGHELYHCFVGGFYE